MHFENLAEEMQIRTEEQRKLLQHYQERGYLYGRQAQDRKSHTWALMMRYEKAMKTSLSKAAVHRQIAAKLGRDEHGGDVVSGKTADAAADVTDNQRYN